METLSLSEGKLKMYSQIFSVICLCW